MAHKAPGKHWRKGITLMQLAQMFPDNETAEEWFISARWPNGVACPKCGSLNVHERPKRKPQRFRCRDCRKDFSTKTGTVMQGSNLGYKTWAWGFYLMTTGIKGTSSLKLHRDLGISQKSAWHMEHRIRETWNNAAPKMAGPVEADETYVGGLEWNKHKDKKNPGTQGGKGKAIVAGLKDHATGQIHATVVLNTTAATLQGFVLDNTAPGAMVFTDESNSYKGLPHHATCQHSIKKWVDGQAHTNGLESFWSMLKRGYHGVYHQMSPKHLFRYVNEFAGRHNNRKADTIEQMRRMVRNTEGKLLRYDDLIG